MPHVAPRLGNPREIAATLSTLSTAHLHEGNADEARAREEEALGIFREVGDRIGEGIGLLHLGEIAMRIADDGNAVELFEQCLDVARSIKHQELEGECERNLGELALAAGSVSRARMRLERSLKVCRDAEDKRNEALTLRWLGKADAAMGAYDSARKRLAEALLAFKAFEMNEEALDCLEDHAELLLAAGRSDDAARLQAAAAAIGEALAFPRSPRSEPNRQKQIERARSALGDVAFRAAWSEGRAWALDEAIDRALAMIAESPAIA